MLHIPTPTSDITVFFVVPLLVFERACVLVWPFSYPKCSESSAARPRSQASLRGVFNCLCIRLLFERIDA